MTAAVVLVLGGLALFGAIFLARYRDALAWQASLVAYRLVLPQGLALEDVVAWLDHMVASTHATWAGLRVPPPVGLEVTADHSGIAHWLIVPARMTGAVLAGLRAALPAVRLEEAPEALVGRSAFGLAAEARLTSLRRPLAHERAVQASASLLAALQPLADGELVHLQWLFVGARSPAPLQADAAVNGELLRAVRLKQAGPLLQAMVRVGVHAADAARTSSLFGQVWGTLRGLNAPGAALVRRWLPSAWVSQCIAGLRLPLTVFPLVLNSKELAGLLGLPLGDVRLPGLPHTAARQLPPAVNMPHTGTVVAMSTYLGMTHRPLALKVSDRLRHSWILGPTGVGKSTLLTNLIVRDIQAGRGVVVLDPKGDLITDVLDRAPESRHDDVLVIEPSATDYPVGLNLLDIGHGEHARELAVDHVVHLLASLWRSSWGPRTSDVLRTALLTLVHARPARGSRFTLIELPELLLNPAFRGFVTAQPTIPDSVRSFWLSYEQMSEGERAQVIGPSLNKLRSFTTRTALRLLLGQSSGVRLSEVFTRRRIILVSLSKGVLGTETAALIGSLVMAGLWQASLERITMPPERRHPVMVYLDEFQDFLRLPVDLADMLAQARGLGVGLTLAHQYLGQLSDEMKTAILGTARTQIVFQLLPDDAHALAARFAPLSQADLAHLAAYEIAVKPCVEGVTLSPVTGRTLPLGDPTGDGQALARASRRRFGVPRAQVDTELRERVTGAAGYNGGFGREGGEG